MRPHPHTELHRLLGPYAGDRRERNQRLVGVERRVGGQRGVGVVMLVRFLDYVIGRLEEEQSSALVAPDVGLVTVVAEALLSTLRHLLGCQLLEGARRDRRRS